MKIGAIDFAHECRILASIRERFSPAQITLRVDANGAFPPGEALEKLTALSTFGLHSIEQPIRAGQPEEMARICRESPVPVALDEELTGITGKDHKEAPPGRFSRPTSYSNPPCLVASAIAGNGLPWPKSWGSAGGSLRPLNPIPDSTPSASLRPPFSRSCPRD